jgi:branched-chain amino acid transport system substrate-binding protein
MKKTTKIWCGISIVAVVAIAVVLIVLQPWKPKQPEVIKIGVIAPFSGDGAIYGEYAKNGIEMALSEINSADGINGVPLEIIYEDDKLDAKEGVSAFKKLVESDGVQVVIGPFTSNVALAIAPVAEEERVVLLSPSATNYKLKDAGDYFFRVCPSDTEQGRILADFTKNDLGAKTAAILYMNTDYGVGLQEVFKKQFANLGGEIVDIESFEMGSTDMRTQLLKIKEKSPEALFMPANVAEAGTLLKQAREIGLTTKFVGGDGSYGPELIKIGGVAAEGLYNSTMGWGNPEKAKEFKSKYKDIYGEEPGTYSALFYEALWVLADAMKLKGTTSEEIKEGLYNINGFEGPTGLTKFDLNGEVQKPYDIYVVKKGKFVLYKGLLE